MFLYLGVPESSRILCCKVYKRIAVVLRWFFPGVFCESVVFTEVRRRSRVLAEAVIILVTEVAWKAWRLCEVSTKVVFVTERLRVSGGGRKWRKVKCSYKPGWACCEVLRGITAFVWNKYSGCVFRHPCVLIRQQTTYHFKHRTRNINHS